MWLFTRLYRRLFPRPVRPPLREDWRAGDVAECIGGDWLARPLKRPATGDRAIVLRVHPGHTAGGTLGWGA